MHRRRFIKLGTYSLANLALVGMTAKRKGKDPHFERYFKVAKILTAKEQLDRDTALMYFDSLKRSKGFRQQLQELYNYLTASKDIPKENFALITLKNDILYQWYTGTIKEGGVELTKNYLGSLSWSCLDFAKPQGVCST